MFAALAFAVTLGGCSTITTLDTPRDVATLEDPPMRLLVQLRGDSTWRALIQPRATADSLFGLWEGSAEPGQPLRQLAAAYEEIDAVRAQRRDVVRTVATPTAVLLMAAMTVWILGAP